MMEGLKKFSTAMKKNESKKRRNLKTKKVVNKKKLTNIKKNKPKKAIVGKKNDA